jgi:hypothetical protein
MKIGVLVYGRLSKCAEHRANILERIGLHHELDFFASSDNSLEIEKFIELYKPIDCTNESISYTCDFSKYPTNRPETNINNMTRHLINKSRVYSLFEKSNRKYEVLIALRIDLFFHDPFDFNDLKENTIYIPEGSDWGGINDQLAYGFPETMEKYFRLFENCEYLLNNGIDPHPETLNRANLEYHKLNVVRRPIGYFIDR